MPVIAAQRDPLGDYVDRKGATGPDLARIIANNLALYQKELNRVRSHKLARPCACCSNFFEFKGEPLCSLCRELALWAAPFLAHLRDVERRERFKEMQRREAERLRRMVEEDDEEEER